MWITERESAAMYARASVKWYGAARAQSVARSIIRKLAKQGDLRGVKTWRLVSEELVRIERERQLSPFSKKNPRRALA
jgi:hypothetical protein